MSNRFKGVGLVTLGLFTLGVIFSEFAALPVSAKPAAFRTIALVNNDLTAPVAVTQGQPALPYEAPAEPVAAPDQPVLPSARSLGELVAAQDDQAALDDEAQCLATAVFYEARSESLAGQLAVANVILNRARSGRFPTSLCGVVTQPGQFSFVRAGHMPDVPEQHRQWPTARAIARIALADAWANPAEGALFFHAARVTPSWQREQVVRIDHHVFYR
jgi:hypothetical protein